MTLQTALLEGQAAGRANEGRTGHKVTLLGSTCSDGYGCDQGGHSLPLSR
jgi:hypothetical protein